MLSSRRICLLGFALLALACHDARPPEPAGEPDDTDNEPVERDQEPVGKVDASTRPMDSSTPRPPEQKPDASVVVDAVVPAPPSESIPAPVPDDCITDVSAGDHTFTCSGVTFLVVVPERCLEVACGLIFDVHGGTMSGLQMRDNTKLHELAPPHGFLVVHPSATTSNTGGSWDLTADPPKVADFFERMIKAFHVDTKRTHFTGFSQGAAHTFYMLCNHPELLASAAPLSGNSADTSCITRAWAPRVPFLHMSGITDSSLMIDTFRTRVSTFVRELELTGGEEIDGDGHYSRKHWEDPSGLDFDFIEHDYGGQPVLAGHCVPGGTDVVGAPNNFGLNATTCTTGDDIKLHWGKLALQWFLDHPRP